MQKAMRKKRITRDKGKKRKPNRNAKNSTEPSDTVLDNFKGLIVPHSLKLNVDGRQGLKHHLKCFVKFTNKNAAATDPTKPSTGIGRT